MQSLAYVPGSNGAANPSLMTVSQVRAPGATTITTNTVAGAPTKFYATMGAPHTFTDPVTGETITVISDATAVDFAGTINAGKVDIVAIAPGYADTRGSLVSDIIVIRPITEWANNLFNILSAAHNDDGTLKTTALDAFHRPSEITPNSFIASGGIIAQTSGLTASFSDIVFYIAGLRYTKTGVANRLYTASKDTYVDIDAAGTLYYTEVANGATTGFTLTAGRLRIAKVVTSGVAITSVVQTGSDVLGNYLYNINPVSTYKANIPYKFRAYRATSAQSVGATTTALLVLNAEDFDSNNNFDIATGRYTCPVSGYYQFSGAVNASVGSGDQYYVSIFKNGSEEARGMDFVPSITFGQTLPVTALIQCAAGDLIDLRFRNGSAAAKNVNIGRTNTFLSGFLVSEL